MSIKVKTLREWLGRFDDDEDVDFLHPFRIPSQTRPGTFVRTDVDADVEFYEDSESPTIYVPVDEVCAEAQRELRTEWDEDKIEREADMAASAYVAVLDKTIEKFGGFPPDFYLAGEALGKRLELEPEHGNAFVKGLLDEWGYDEQQDEAEDQPGAES